MASSLDINKHNRNKFCGRYSLKGYLEQNGEKKIRYARLGCKGWNCQICGPRKASKYRHSIKEQALKLNLDRFLTLTLDPKKCKPHNSLPHIKKSWAKFRISLKRKYGHSISFICIVEFQKNGYAHLHILVDRFIPQKWISHAWNSVGGGKIAFIERVELKSIAYYITKYLTKDTNFNNSGKRYRKCTTSRNIKLNYHKKSGKWVVMTVPIEEIHNSYKKQQSKEHRDMSGMLHWFEISV